MSGNVRWGGSAANTAAFEQESTAAGGTSKGINTVTGAYVQVSQEQGPTAEFNTSTATIHNSQTGEDVPNVLYGSGGWLGPHHGAFEVRSKDPGLGIKEFSVSGAGWSDRKEYDFGFEPTNCIGVQCPESVNQAYVYKRWMVNGEKVFEGEVEDPVGLYALLRGERAQKIKIDGAPPHGITIKGFQNGNELPAGETKLKVEATDGEGTTKSSGVKSIKLTVDGQSISGSSASCAEGPCTANTEATLAARDFTSGEHTLIVTAEDNANNVVQEEFTFRVHGATPLSVGPGSVNPSSGEFMLSASDASLGGAAGVTRSYQSRHLTAGAEGPLGPQWQLSVGGGEGLSVYPEGEAVLTSASGARTTFERNEKGEYESPEGDSNLRLEAKEEQPGKGISYYLLSDATAASSTKFRQPSGILGKPPSLDEEFGSEVQLKTPASEAIDATGDVWVTGYGNGLIEKFSPGGALLGTYGSAGTLGGELSGPWGIAINASNGKVYVSDANNDRVEELSSAGGFIRAFGWGVKDGKQELEVCETSGCKAGLAGSGAGEFSAPRGVALDASGNVWVADCSNDRVEELSATGSFIRQAGSAGSGNGQFSCPAGLTVENGDIYVVDSGNNRVQELGPGGEYLAQFGSEGTGEGKLRSPSGIASEAGTGDLYVADTNNNRVEEFTSTGGFIDSFGKTGTGEGQFAAGGPLGVAVSPLGVIYATNTAENRIGAWDRPTWVPVEAGGSGAASTYAYTSVEVEGKPSIQPSEVLAPKSAGVSSCEPLARGCRALTFNYATATTATGESESEWGDYPGRLTRVYFHGWDPAKSEMTTTEVAHYLYDAQGRLRAEWDPRIEQARDCGGPCSALKTIYGYDTEGHVTAVRSPGQQPWALIYGTLAGDSNTGRLLKVARAKASTPLGSAEAPFVSQAPVISGSGAVGVTLGVTTGKWGGEPVAYGYQWKDCNVLGLKCVAIPGATNPNYKVAESDVGHVLQAVVTATNAGGSSVSSMSESEVARWGQKDDPVEAAAIFPPDEPQRWPAGAYTRATISYWDAHGRVVNTATPSGAIATSEYNNSNDVIRSLSAEDREAAIKEGSKSAEASKLFDTESRYNGETQAEQAHEAEETAQGKRNAPEPGTELLETKGPRHTVKLAEGGMEVLARNHVRYFYDEGSPEGRHYGLLTKTIDGAEYDGKEGDQRTSANSYAGQGNLGWTLRKPTSTTTDPGGLNLTTSTVYDKETGRTLETTSPAGNLPSHTPVYASTFGTHGSGAGQLSAPKQFAFDAKGELWVADEDNNRISIFNESGTFIKAIGWGVLDGKAEVESCTSNCKVGVAGSGNGQFSAPKGIAIANGHVWVTDTSNNRLEELAENGEFLKAVGSAGTGDLQFSSPRGLTIDAHGNVWVADDMNNRIEELNENGEFVKVIGWGVLDGKTQLETCTSASCKAGIAGSGNGQLKEPQDQAIDAHGHLWVSDGGNNRLQEYAENGEYIKTVGSTGSGAGQFSSTKEIKFDNNGNLWVVDEANHRIQELSETGEFLLTFGWGVTDGNAAFEVCAKEAPSCKAGLSGSGNGQFGQPWGLTVDAHGKLVVSDESNHRLETFTQSNAALHTTQTVYYSGTPNPARPACGNHAEWAGLPCQTQPAQQPEDAPNLPVSSYAYNIWDEVTSTEETFGTTTRTKAETYDNAGRALISSTSSSVGSPLPAVTNQYSPTTGALVQQSTETGGRTETIASKFNSAGQLTEYTDAEGNTAKYEYEEGGDERLLEVSEGKGEEAHSSRTYSYDPTTGLPTKLVDSAAGGLTFTAKYDPEGKLTSETYPGGLESKYTYNTASEAAMLEYVKTHGSEHTTWFSDSQTPSVHGEVLAQTSTLASEHYSYDNAGRLTQTQEEPAGKPCATRLYGYDEESNRASLTTREGTEGKCATEGGTAEHHAYDSANRLTDTGVSYETFGNTTKLPAADTGTGHELTSSYYVDNQLESQTQNGETLTYTYDPAGRTLTTHHSNPNTTTISHYAGVSGTAAWTSEGAGVWTRNIAGLDGSLCGTQTSTGAVTLQLHDLGGNIIATAGTSETETTLQSSYNSTEFGVPQPGTTPPKYAWQGATGLATETALGTAGVANPGGSSYVPLIGRPLQTLQIASPGAFPDGAATTHVIQATYTGAVGTILKGIAVEEQAAEEQAAREQAEEEARLNQCGSACYVGPGNLPEPTEGGVEEAVELEPGPGGGNAGAANLQHYGRLGPCSVASEGIGVREDGLELWTFTTKIKCNSRTEGTFVIESESGSALPEAFVAHGIHPVEFTTLLTTAAGAEIFFELLVNKKHYRKRYNHGTVG